MGPSVGGMRIGVVVGFGDGDGVRRDFGSFNFVSLDISVSLGPFVLFNICGGSVRKIIDGADVG